MASLRNCCFFVPIKTGVYLITIFGLLNKLSGFYGLVSLEFNDPMVAFIHFYSLLSLVLFALGLYGIYKEKFNYIRWFVMFYWVDFIINTTTMIYLSVQWFVYTDHSLPELEQDMKLQHDETFRAESIVSIICLGLITAVRLYFAGVLTCYYRSLNNSQYSKLKTEIDQELNFE